MWTCPLWPLQLGVERVQHVELHGFEKAVTLVFKYNRHHNLTSILQVSLDVINLGGRKKKNSFNFSGNLFIPRIIAQAQDVPTFSLHLNKTLNHDYCISKTQQIQLIIPTPKHTTLFPRNQSEHKEKITRTDSFLENDVISLTVRPFKEEQQEDRETRLG